MLCRVGNMSIKVGMLDFTVVIKLIQDDADEYHSAMLIVEGKGS